MSLPGFRKRAEKLNFFTSHSAQEDNNTAQVDTALYFLQGLSEYGSP